MHLVFVPVNHLNNIIQKYFKVTSWVKHVTYIQCYNNAELIIVYYLTHIHVKVFYGSHTTVQL